MTPPATDDVPLAGSDPHIAARLSHLRYRLDVDYWPRWLDSDELTSSLLACSRRLSEAARTDDPVLRVSVLQRARAGLVRMVEHNLLRDQRRRNHAVWLCDQLDQVIVDVHVGMVRDIVTDPPAEGDDAPGDGSHVGDVM